jgi:hypothetical protein
MASVPGQDPRIPVRRLPWTPIELPNFVEML